MHGSAVFLEPQVLGVLLQFRYALNFTLPVELRLLGVPEMYRELGQENRIRMSAAGTVTFRKAGRLQAE